MIHYTPPPFVVRIVPLQMNSCQALRKNCFQPECRKTSQPASQDVLYEQAFCENTVKDWLYHPCFAVSYNDVFLCLFSRNVSCLCTSPRIFQVEFCWGNWPPCHSSTHSRWVVARVCALRLGYRLSTTMFLRGVGRADSAKR